jgi:hypothetical protein
MYKGGGEGADEATHYWALLVVIRILVFVGEAT